MCVVGLQLESLKRSCERVRSVFTICHPGCALHYQPSSCYATQHVQECRIEAQSHCCINYHRCKEEEERSSSSRPSSKTRRGASGSGLGAAPGLGKAGGAGANSQIRRHCLEESGFGGKEAAWAAPARHLACRDANERESGI